MHIRDNTDIFSTCSYLIFVKKDFLNQCNMNI